MADVSMPIEMVTWMRRAGWGPHHLQWHIERILESRPNLLPFATSQGWSPAPLQEGAPDNGLEFLAMHRAMIHRLIEAFPQHADLLSGWDRPPEAPDDANDPLPPGKVALFDADKSAGTSRLHDELDSFDDDDALGLFIQTRRRPTDTDPLAVSGDRSAGIHNYLHNRFDRSGSAIALGDPQVNIENRQFWRLHGWIDARWSAFRAAKGLTDDDPAYVAALQAGYQHMPLPPPPIPVPTPTPAFAPLADAAGDGPLAHEHGAHKKPGHHHMPSRIEIPAEILAQIREAFYFCTVETDLEEGA